LNSKTGAPLGSVSDEELQVLVEALEEESAADREYYINRPTIDLLEAGGRAPGLVRLLQVAIGSDEDLDIRWEPDQD
jgi:hypothetical protein